MEQTLQTQHREVIINDEIECVLMAFKNAAECVPRGICQPDEAKIIVSKYYVAFTDGRGEVKLVRGGFVEVRAGSYLLFTNSWDMFTLKHAGKLLAYGPKLAVGRDIYTTDEFIEYIRKSFKVLLSATGWV
jgi:hypothetical protein